MRRFWSKKGKAVKKWRSRAWSIDPNKTNLIILEKEKNYQHVPPWVYKKWVSSQIT